jgi:hypothetical protein
MSIPHTTFSPELIRAELAGPETDSLKIATPDAADASLLSDLLTNGASGTRVTLDPNTVQHDLAKLVLSLVETIRQLLERQALRRVEGGRLSAEQIEQMGLTLMRLEERMAELKAQFGLEGEDLRLNLAGLLDEL